jgi:Pyruvate/2-oxoacid:ferredoxin oxidoreductase gamma subunit
VANLVDRDALRKAVGDSVPPSFRDLNLKAFDRGYDYGIQALQTTPETGVVENEAHVFDGVQ